MDKWKAVGFTVSACGAILGLNTVNIKATTIATVHNGVTAHLCTREGSNVDNRALAPNSPWQVGETLQLNGDTLYQVSTNEFVKSSDVDVSGNNNEQTPNKIVGYATKNIRLFNDEQNKLSDTRSLAKGSYWQVGRVVKNAKGEIFFQVSTHEWAEHGDMVIDGNEPSNIEYVADFANSSNGQGTNVDNGNNSSDNNQNGNETTVTDNNNNNGSGSTGEVVQPTLPKPSAAELQQAVIDSIAKYRQDHGLNPQRVDPILMQSSAIRAKEMLNNGYGHERPDGNVWYSAITDITGGGLNFHCDENLITFGYYEGSSAEEEANAAMAGFLGDEGHAKPIITNSFTRIGVGVIDDAEGDGYYVVEHFADEPY